MHVVSKRINEEELQELFPEGVWKSLNGSYFASFAYHVNSTNICVSVCYKLRCALLVLLHDLKS